MKVVFLWSFVQCWYSCPLLCKTVCNLLPGAGITRSILWSKSKHSYLEKCPQVTGGFCFEVGGRRDFHVLSLDMRKGPYLGCVKTHIFQKAREVWEILMIKIRWS